MSDPGKKGTVHAMRVKLRYPDVETFKRKFAANVSRSGLFLASANPRPVGDTVKFELLLADGKPILKGEGEVRWVRRPDPQDPRKPHGMGLHLTQLDPASQALVDEIQNHKREAGEPDDQGTPSYSTLPDMTGPVALLDHDAELAGLMGEAQSLGNAANMDTTLDRARSIARAVSEDGSLDPELRRLLTDKD